MDKLRSLRRFKTYAMKKINLREYILGSSVKKKSSIVYNDDTIGSSRFFHIVSYVNDRNILFPVKLFDYSKNLASAYRIEHSGRLIEYYNVRLHCNYTRYSNSLLLTARKLMRCVTRVFRHTNGFKCLVNAFSYFRALDSKVFRSERNVLLDYRSYKLVVGILEYHSNFFPHAMCL